MLYVYMLCLLANSMSAHVGTCAFAVRDCFEFARQGTIVLVILHEIDYA